MKRPMQAVLVQGALGGILAGVVVALWFLVVDLAAGQPFRAPAVLAAALFHQEATQATFRLVASYTVLHFGAFTLLGVAMAWAIAPLEAPPRVLLGVVFGLVVLDVVFYTALLLTGARLLHVLPWPHVLGANLLSGVVLMGYLHRAQHDARPFGPIALRRHPLLWRGAITGLIGAAAVAVWFFALDLAAGRPFRTPGALGSALFLGASGAAEIQASLGTVAAYTVVHLAAFAVAGVVFVAVAEQIERAPALLLLGALAFIVLEAVVVTMMALGAEWVLGTLGWWSVGIGNLVAVGGMGWYVWATHPVLRERLRHGPVEVRV
jgi:hypothetical protein